MSALLVCPIFVSALLLGSAPQNPPPDAALLNEGLRLVAELTLDAAQDNARFQQVGVDRASQLLAAVLSHGQRPDATREDWATMHRAADGLIELYAAKGDHLRAAVYASLQSALYRNYDEDLVRGLDAAQRGLALKRASGSPASIYLEHTAIGQILMALGRTSEALGALRVGRDGNPEPLGDHASMQWRLIIEGEIARGDFAAARREADAFAALASSSSAPPRAHALLAMAIVDVAERKFDAALDRVLSARALAAKGPGAEMVELEATQTLSGLVLDAARELPYDQALALAGRIDREFRGLFIELTPFARMAARGRRRLSGDFDAIIREDAEALERARQARSAGGQIEALRSMAATYAALNADNQVAALLQEALSVARGSFAASGPPTNPVEADELYGIAIALADAQARLEQLDEARTSFEQTIAAINGYSEAALRRQLGSTLGEAIVGLAGVVARGGDVAAAAGMLKQALDGKPADARFNRADVLGELARLERDTAPALAVEHYEQAIAALVQQRDRRTEILRRLQLAEYLAKHATAGADRLERARRHLAIVTRDAELLNYSDALWRVRFVEGLIAEAGGRTQHAIDAYAAAVDRLDQIRSGLSRQEQRASFLDSEAVQGVYHRLVRLHTAGKRRHDAWAFLERGKARTFLEMLHGRQFASAAAAPERDELRALEQQIVALRVALAPESQPLSRGAGRESARVLRELRSLEQKFVLARQQASLSANRSTQPLAIQPISLPEVQKRLPSRSALVEYALLDDRITAFVVSASAVEQLAWPADLSRLRADVEALRTALSDPTMGDNTQEPAKRIAAAVIARVLPRVPAGTEHVIVVPAGVLTYVPFEALPAGKGKQLLDLYSVSYLPSASTLQYLSAAAAPSDGDRTFLGVLGNASVEDWPPLPGTIAETDGILKLFPNATRASEGTFTRAAAIDALGRYDRVHFATHGLLDEQAPIFSAVLMGTNAGGSTRLSLYDVADVPLSAKLVVLSACETGLGTLLRGDEVTGLTRTFLQAGAAAVVSSLWKVADDSTAVLMQKFYAGLRDGLRPSRALRRAALEMRTQFGHPFYWAPFVLTGVE